MLPIFLIKFLFPCPLVCKPLRKHALPDQTHAGFLFSLIGNPRGYQYIGTSPFPDSFHFAKSRTNPKHHRDWKTQTSSTKYWSRPRLFFFFIPSSELQTKNIEASIGPQQLHGPANSSIELLSLPSTQPQSVNWHGWMSVLFWRQPPIPLNRNPPKNISYSTKTLNLKKNFRINLITNISKAGVKSSVNGFHQIL